MSSTPTNTKSWLKPAASLFCSIILVASTLNSVNAQDIDASALNSDASLAVNTGKVEMSDFTRYLSINGSINAWQDVIIASEVGGYRIEEVLVDVGDYVHKGQQLIKLSTALLETELASRQAVLKQRKAEAVVATLALQRGKSIAEKNLLSASDIDRLESDSIGAEGRVEAAEADLEAARVRLQYANVIARDDGVITARNVSVGQIVQAGSELLRLLRQNRVEWRGEVPENSLLDLNVGDPVTVTSVDGREHAGIIRIVSPTVNANTHNGTVYVDVASDDALRPGMFARGKIEVSKGQALLVPLNAMTTNDGYHYVFIVNADHTVRKQLVETGVLQDNKIEILSGLKAGSTIVTNGAGFLKDGDIVNIIGVN